ncbi:hypothetical protein [Miniphocaeibacter massiliensis]|uniref:hypothetical protein n=1 Tax=Miniphocaeibacter massiliensis TaxID=2041841 RepID=UPI000C1B7F58|nr:hypothetical protein [Miniphocaeibacter massiliensis]
MKITMVVMLIVGLVEVGANSFFIIRLMSGKGLRAAKKFHGDFPAFASDKAWINKILVSIVLGFLALLAAFTIYKNYSTKIIFSGLFAGGMLVLCIVQAVLYGKKHLPARISILIGVVLIALVAFRL